MPELDTPEVAPRPSPKNPAIQRASSTGRMSLRLARAKNKKKILSELEVNDIERFDQEYTLLEKIGQGNYGSVYKAQHNKTEIFVAVKSVYAGGHDMAELEKEIDIMRGIDSDHIVRYYGTFMKDNTCWIIMEYCFFGSCGDIMSVREKPFDEPEIAVICRDAIMGLNYLHEHQRIHRDIKADNILVNDKGECKLADFGVSGKGEKLKTVIGTPFFVAPEIIINEGFYDRKVDIWSLGITAIELAEMLPPYANEQPMKVLFNIPTKPPPTLSHPEDYSEDFVDFIEKCLIKDPQQRPTTEELLKHKFIAEAGLNTIVMQDVIEETSLLIDQFFEEEGEDDEESSDEEDEEEDDEEEEEGEDEEESEEETNTVEENKKPTQENKKPTQETKEEPLEVKIAKIESTQINHDLEHGKEVKDKENKEDAKETKQDLIQEEEKEKRENIIQREIEQIEPAKQESSPKKKSEKVDSKTSEEAVITKNETLDEDFEQNPAKHEHWWRFLKETLSDSKEGNSDSEDEELLKQVRTSGTMQKETARKRLAKANRTVSIGKTLQQIMEDETQAMEAKIEKQVKQEPAQKEEQIVKKPKKESKKKRLMKFFGIG